MVVRKVDKGSIAQECEIVPGDELLSINGRELRDYIDYIYELSSDEITVLVRKKDGNLEEIEIEKEPDEELGIAFEADGFGKKIVCRNKCIFCFVDQMPEKMRRTLYVKDDDWRMSFLMGSYVTLTNLSDEEAERIIEQKISPLYVSVHAYDGEIRKLLMGNENAEKTFSLIRRFAQSGIQMHTQIGMCEDINDGAVLEETIVKLYELYPGVQSVAVVPAGLTRFREGRYPLQPVSEANAEKTIRLVHRLQKEFLESTGRTRFVFASDEMYIRAKEALPPYEAYEDFVQIENGVGLVGCFLHEAYEAMKDFCEKKARYESVGFITGIDFYPFLKELALELGRRFGMKISIQCVENRFFGETITVAGLLTGGDVLDQVRPDGAQALFLSRCCFKENEDAMLDGISLEMLEDAFGLPCFKADTDGYELIQMLLK